MNAFLKTGAVTVAAVSLAIGGQAQASELIVDGGFEQQIVTTPGLFQSGFVPYASGQHFGGPSNASWTVVGSGNNIAVTSTTEFTSGPTFYNGHSGLQWVDLSGEFDNGAAVGIQQIVTTVIGARYNLGFWVGSFVDAPTSINVLVNGSNVGTFTNPTGGSAPGNGNNWRYFSQSVTATSSSTSLAFYFAGGRSVAGIDDISFTSTAAVPEPATWALMLFGFGLVGSAMRRQAKVRGVSFT
jgi:hypothetical protein